MRLKRCILVLSAILLGMVGGAAFEADSLAVVGDTTAVDSVRVAKGFDAGNYVNAKRWRVPAHTQFKYGPFRNISLGLRTGIVRIMDSDHSFGQASGIELVKWVHPSVGVRLGGSYGGWIDNFDARRIRMADVSLSVLFNLMSYVGGYDTSRLCDVSIVGGVAYNRLWKDTAENENVLSSLFGLNLDLKIYDRLHLFVEPQMNVYYDSDLLLDTWRSYMTGFTGVVGLNYNFGQVRPTEKRQTKYFISVWGGGRVQNSSLVLQKMGKGEMLGYQVGLGYGRWYNDWFAMRLSATFSRNPWLKYSIGILQYSQYFDISLEGMFNLLGMWKNELSEHLSLSALIGPEVGRMIKDDKDFRISEHYFGLTGGFNASVKVHKSLSIFLEPRFDIVPYSAVSGNLDSPLDNQNYFDALLGLNVGINILIP